MKPLRKLAFVINQQKSGAPELARDLLAMANKAGVETKATGDYPLPEGFLEGWDACCVIGGDGTLLSVAAEAARWDVPVIGVNRGSLGFLTPFSSEEVRHCFPTLLRGEFKVAQRALIACRTSADRADIALNDVLIKDERNSKLVKLSVFANGEFVTDYYSDGLIFATPTGSTAYNLSAGGPLIYPSSQVIAMTPICPHALSNRSIVFPDDLTLEIRNTAADAKLLIAIDGQRNLQVSDTGSVQITKSPLRLRLVQQVDHEHFAIVRHKLKWNGGSNV